MSDGVPLFANTQEALAYGRAIDTHTFPVLVRTWLVSQRAFEHAENLQAKCLLAYRVQTLREAVEAAVGIDGYQFGKPAATEDPFLEIHGVTTPEPAPPSSFDPLPSSFTEGGS